MGELNQVQFSPVPEQFRLPSEGSVQSFTPPVVSREESDESPGFTAVPRRKFGFFTDASDNGWRLGGNASLIASLPVHESVSSGTMDLLGGVDLVKNIGPKSRFRFGPVFGIHTALPTTTETTIENLNSTPVPEEDAVIVGETYHLYDDEKITTQSLPLTGGLSFGVDLTIDPNPEFKVQYTPHGRVLMNGFRKTTQFTEYTATHTGTEEVTWGESDYGPCDEPWFELFFLAYCAAVEEYDSDSSGETETYTQYNFDIGSTTSSDTKIIRGATLELFPISFTAGVEHFGLRFDAGATVMMNNAMRPLDNHSPDVSVGWNFGVGAQF